MVRDGYFGFQDYFKSLCDSVEGGNDFYLLGSDFESYLKAQVTHVSLGRSHWNLKKIVLTIIMLGLPTF